jgi:hypothetical protein
MGTHRKPVEQWNPAVANTDWDEDKYQSTWGSTDMSADPSLSTVQFSSPGTHDVWDN